MRKVCHKVNQENFNCGQKANQKKVIAQRDFAFTG